MADLQKTIQVIYSGQDKISGTLKSISSSMDSFAGGVNRATQPLADLTDKIVKIETILAGLAIGALALATREAGKFGDSFNEIATLIDVPRAGLETFRGQIVDYGRDSTQTFEDINESIYSAISAGVDYTKALDSLEISEKLAIATKGRLSDSTLLLSQTINAYGGDVTQADRFAAVYFQTIKSGVTRIDELSSSMGKVTTIASQLGIPLETIAAALVALTKSGLNTSEAVTTLSSLFNSFLKPTDAVNKILGENAGLWSVSAIKAKGFETALRDGLEAINYDEAAIAKLTGRKEALIAALILGIDKSGFFKQALLGMGDATRNFDAAYEKMSTQFENHNQRIINSLRGTLIDLGTPLLDEWGDIATSLSAVFQGVSVGIDKKAFDEVFKVLEAFGVDVAKFLADVAISMPDALKGLDFTGFLDSIKDLAATAGDLFKDFFGDIDLTTPEGLEQALQKMVDTMTTLTRVTDGILESFRPFVRILGDYVDKALKTEEGTQKIVGEFLGWAKQINVISGAIPSLTGALNLLAAAIGGRAIVDMGKWVTGLSQMGGAVGTVVTKLGKLSVALAAFSAGYAFGSWLVKTVPQVDKMANVLANMALGVIGLSDDQMRGVEAQAAYTKALGEVKVAAINMADSLEAIPTDKEIAVDIALKQAFTDLDQFEYVMMHTPIFDAKKIDLELAYDAADLKDTASRFIFAVNENLPEEDQILEIKINPDYESIDSTKAAIDNKLPSEKLMEVKIRGEIERDLAKIQAQAQVLQTAFEWQAKVEIAEVEANVLKVQALAESTAKIFESTGKVIGDIIGAITGTDLSASEWLELRRLLEAESQRRDELVASQIKLNNAEAEWTEKRTEALDRGDAMITIKADGLYPELDLVLHEIVRRAQLTANAEGLEFLGL